MVCAWWADWFPMELYGVRNPDVKFKVHVSEEPWEHGSTCCGGTLTMHPGAVVLVPDSFDAVGNP